jgi:hypothetical protein
MVHTTSPLYLQRSAVVAGLAFVFFLIMMAAFYARQWFVYFLLATAFLVVNLFTLAGIWLQKRNTVRIYANGLRYKKSDLYWSDVVRLQLSEKAGLVLTDSGGRELVIPRSIGGIRSIADHIRSRIETAG